MKFLLVLAVSTSTWAYSQSGITFEQKDGLNWIKIKSETRSFTMSPINPLSASICNKTKDYLLNDGMVTSCKDNLLSCNLAFLAKHAPKYAFGLDFLEDRKPAASSKVNWKIVPKSNSLNPELIPQYAAQLGIDPKKSVIEYIDEGSLASSIDMNRPIVFRPYTKGIPGGNSWYFRNVVGMLLQNDEDKALEKTIYFNKSGAESKTVQLVSRFLNCELQNTQGEYVQLPVRTEVLGVRAVSDLQGEEVFGALRILEEMSFPDDYTEVEKSMMYGFELGSRLEPSTKEAIGMDQIVSKLFKMENGKIAVRYWESSQALTRALRIYDSYKESNGYVTLSLDTSEGPK